MTSRNTLRLIRLGYRSAMLLRLTSHVIGYWPIILISVYFTFTTVPHVLVDRKHCTYLGSRGFVQAYHLGHCHHRLVIFDSAKAKAI